MITIILSHPWHGSFNKAIVDTIIQKLETEKKEYQLIDLHKDKFNPSFEESDLSVFGRGQYKDPKVGEYQEKLKIQMKLFLSFLYGGVMRQLC